MRHYIDLVESAGAAFRLHPALNPDDYVMTSSLRDHESWRARVYEGNNAENPKKVIGTMGQIGYVMISMKDNTIIPIANADEHHSGRDVLSDLAQKHKFSDRDYIPIYCYGTVYIYRESEIPVLLNVLEKFLSYGGVNGVVEGTSQMRDVPAMTLKQFVERKGDVTVTPGKLAPIGATLVDLYEKCAQAVRKARQTPDSRSAFGAACHASLDVVKFLLSLKYLIMGDFKLDDLRAFMTKIKDIQHSGDLQALEEAMFGFHSLKNLMHSNLRKERDRLRTDPTGYSFYGEKAKSIWGDIGLAVDVLARF